MKVDIANIFPLHDGHDASGDDRYTAEAVESMAALLAKSGYSRKAIDYYLHKPHLGIIADADIVTEYTGTCGDSLILYLSISDGVICNAKFQVTGCAGALTASMALGDLITGKDVDFAASIDDSMVFHHLEQIPAEKHECIQLAVKTLHKALEQERNQKKQNSNI